MTGTSGVRTGLGRRHRAARGPVPAIRPGDAVALLMCVVAVVAVAVLDVRVVGKGTTPLWGLTGLVVAALLWRGRVAALLAAALGVLAVPWLGGAAVLSAMLGALAALAGVAVVVPAASGGMPVVLKPRARAVAVLVSVTLLAPVLAAVVGVAVAELLGADAAPGRWIQWAAAAALGCLLMPLALLLWWFSPPVPRLSPGAAVEAALAAGLLVCCTGVMLWSGEVPASLLVMVPLVWIAMRWFERAVVLATYVVTSVISLVSLAGHGSFAHQEGRLLADDLLRLWALVGLVLVCGVVVAYVARQRDEARTRLSSDNVALAASETERRRTLDTLVSNLPGLAYRCRNDATYAVLFVSEGVRDVLGVDAETVTAGPGGLAAYIHPDDLDRIRREVDEAVAADRPFRLDYRMVRADGGVRWVWEQGRSVGADADGVARLEGFLYDVTDQVTSQQVLADEARLLDVAVRRGSRTELLEVLADLVDRHMPDGDLAVVVLSGDGTVDRALHRTASGELPSWCPRPGAPLPAGPLAEAGEGQRSEQVLDDEPSPVRPLRLTALPVGGGGEAVAAVVCIASRVPLRADEVDPLQHLAVVAAAALGHIDAQDRLLYESRHDPLTELPNRRGLEDELDDWLTTERPAHVGVLFVDVATFRVVNETYGHQVGDDVLRSLAHRLRTALPPGVLVGRFSGDQFVVAVQDDDQESLLGIGRLVQRVAAGPYRIGEQSLHLDVTAGLASTSGGPASTTSLLSSAATACDAARARGRDVILVFDEALREESRRSLLLQTALRRAVAAGELETWYQPQYDLRNGRLVGVEALVRWRTPEGDLLAPADFLAAAEASGLMTPLGLRVLTTACQDAMTWPDSEPPLVVSVNVAAAQLVDPLFATSVADVLRFTRLPADRLCLEVTEAALADVDAAAASLARLKGLGVTVAIDDFGTGFSALSRLKRIPLDVLKIDKSFVDGVGRDAHDTAIVTAVVALARALHVRTVAEGVESGPQAAELRARGVDVGQGYLWSRPVPAAHLLEMLSGERRGSLKTAIAPFGAAD